AYPSPDAYFWGGTEEMLIAKGTDWCGEVARVFCALTQAMRIPSRIVYTFSDTDGHVLNECFVNNQWVLVDSTNNIVYWAKDRYYSAWDVIGSLAAFGQLFGKNKAYYCAPEFFKYVAVSEYMLADAEKYSYRIAFCNDYYRKALKDAWNNA
ncbi:MAG TPA: transglutaminase domain-containing protein, partial [Candidatus Ruminococcus gallistercoris]|nr:transglutaminase domain-containing protein [Candidatus Ruminococcus gallistercoris]